jgi:hypothetical protein
MTKQMHLAASKGNDPSARVSGLRIAIMGASSVVKAGLAR